MSFPMIPYSQTNSKSLFFIYLFVFYFYSFLFMFLVLSFFNFFFFFLTVLKRPIFFYLFFEVLSKNFQFFFNLQSTLIFLTYALVQQRYNLLQTRNFFRRCSTKLTFQRISMSVMHFPWHCCCQQTSLPLLEKKVKSESHSYNCHFSYILFLFYLFSHAFP